MSKWQSFIQGLNDIHSNWFGFAILCIGVYVAMRGRSDVANPIIVGAFAIINSANNKEISTNVSTGTSGNSTSTITSK